MKQKGQGILPESEIYFASPSVRARKLFYHVLCAGHFFCDNAYSLKRENYDSFLILHVIKGSFSFINKDGNEMTANEGETVIIDCYKPHSYCTYNNLESVWVHVAGCNVPSMCESIINTRGSIVQLRNTDKVKGRIFKLFDGINGDGRLSEAEISLEVYKLVLDLCEEQGINENEGAMHGGSVQKIKDYIAAHFCEDISVKQLADMAHMSATHFSRVFKQISGFSPYDYVVNVRLNRAKELLLRSDLSVTRIAYETGFNSEANFVYCFTKNEGISPGKFRKRGF